VWRYERDAEEGRPEELLLAEESSEGLCFVGQAFNTLRGADRGRLATGIEATAQTTSPIPT
jgi:hypothetical protein